MHVVDTYSAEGKEKLSSFSGSRKGTMWLRSRTVYAVFLYTIFKTRRRNVSFQTMERSSLGREENMLRPGDSAMRCKITMSEVLKRNS